MDVEASPSANKPTADHGPLEQSKTEPLPQVDMPAELESSHAEQPIVDQAMAQKTAKPERPPRVCTITASSQLL